MKKMCNLTGFAAMAALSLASVVRAGNFATITVDGNVSDWAGISPAATADATGDGKFNSGTQTTVDYSNLYIANDANYIYFRYTLATAASPTSYNSNYFIDSDVDNETTLGHPTGYGIGDSELLVQYDNVYQENSGDFNDGQLSGEGFGLDNTGLQVGNFSATATDGFEYRISRSAKFSNNSAVFTGSNIAIFLESDGDSGAGDTYGPIFYTLASATTPEPTSLGLISVSLLPLMRRRRRIV